MPDNITLSNLTTNGGSSFRIKRPLVTTSGFVSDIDTTVKDQLDELNELLGKRVFKANIQAVEELNVADLPLKGKGPDPYVREGKEAAAAGRAPERTRVTPNIKQFLSAPLTFKRVPGNSWAAGSLVAELKKAVELPENIALSDYIDMTPDLSALKYAVQSALEQSWFNLDYNTKTILDGYPAIRDYLIAFGFHMMDLEEVNAIKNFIVSNPSGAKKIANYATVSAARTIIDQEGLAVDKYNEDDSPFVKQLKTAGLSLSSLSFKSALRKRIKEFVQDSDEALLIEQAGLGKLPAGIKPQLIRYIQRSAVPITADNIKFFLPTFISQARATSEIGDINEVEAEESDLDFDVQFPAEDNSQIQISKAAVKCAAQLYYGMVLGDELEVFNTMNFFTHHYLLRERIEIEDRRLREDLQMYVFDNKFSYLTKGNERKIADRTRPSERQMFYQQCFDEGGEAQKTDVFVRNQEYRRLWKVMILESAKYLERARESFNPNSYVSKQNVMQAVEDLQYNLSTHCTGMANVITPLIYEELNFIIGRIFMHKEVLRQVVPSGSTWWRVVEKLYEGMRRSRPKATVLFNKAKLGHQIIRSIADYNPASFEDEKTFSAFISHVDAFITTQSILQEALTDDLIKGEREDEEELTENQPKLSLDDYAPAGAAVPMPQQAPQGADEWDF